MALLCQNQGKYEEVSFDFYFLTYDIEGKCLNFGTPEIMNFHLEQMENELFSGVPILKYITICLNFGIPKIIDLPSATDGKLFSGVSILKHIT